MRQRHSALQARSKDHCPAGSREESSFKLVAPLRTKATSLDNVHPQMQKWVNVQQERRLGLPVQHTAPAAPEETLAAFT